MESPRARMRAPTMSPYGLRLPRMSSRGRAPASRMNAIASIAQSQRLSGSNRATFTKVGRSPNASRSGRASAGGSGFKKRSAMPFGRTAASTPTADISARMKRETVVIDAASRSSEKSMLPKP